MATAEVSEVFPCSVEQFFSVISDYEKYPEFLSEVKSCKVIQTENNRKLVEYQVSLLKTFTYRLWMQEEAPHKITWDLSSGDLFKASHGSWTLTEEAGQTRALYQIDVQFSLFVPKPIANSLVKVNLPNMMNSYQKRIKEIYS